MSELCYSCATMLAPFFSCSSASETMRSTRSLHVGMSLMRPTDCPHDHMALFQSPVSCHIFFARAPLNVEWSQSGARVSADVFVFLLTWQAVLAHQRRPPLAVRFLTFSD